MGAPGGVGGGPPQPPTIKETESQAIVELTKKYVLALVADSMMEVIPFTQREYDEVFKYRSEPDRPSLHPLAFLRASSAGLPTAEDSQSQSVYQELFNSLPADVQGWVTSEMNMPVSERDPSYAAVNNVLTAAANALVRLSAAGSQPAPNTGEAQDYVNSAALPYVALSSVIEQSTSTLAAVQSWLNTEGANYPGFDSLSNTLQEMKADLSALQNLAGQVAAGASGPEVQQQFIDVANQLTSLAGAINTDAQGPNAQILGVQISALALAASAWALSSASPSLLIGSEIASAGNDSNNYTAALNTFLDGILQSASLGPQAQLEELNSLYNNLIALSSGG